MDTFTLTSNSFQNAADATPLPYDVVSIQSQVVYGSVGNSIAVPALTKQGLRVAAVPTVILSNTPHYASCYGGELPGEWFRGYLQGFVERGSLNSIKAILTGYLGSPDKAHDLANWLGSVREQHPKMPVIVDPVMGDEDSGFYIPPAIADVYRHEVIPLATGIIPNKFELSTLSGQEINNLDDATRAARSLLKGHTQWVIITSAFQPDEESIEVVCVTKQDVAVIRHKRYPVTPKGTGDLFGAELTAQLLAGLSVPDAAKMACLRIEQGIIHMAATGRSELVL
ncbi:pyridoxine/pyridoxal/pyridoxamine kinase [Providencia sp. PROV188]|uniref:pyridoxine/pyridoxal/pyridoxamine kinase n=1 Tax=Providencia TaxID=586 RepID=UPI0012B5AF20|nr:MULTISPECIES: pyridoxine/pyridoxal/pyridoxamine kinase [Providencia]MTB44381.1 pyridoxine/pyridoxal/pyridoxamine kinase [Providencia sp. wls1950]MTC21694.1 pyridoxine/pyridoxal/pyridoxamine kinase [Providencia sp. wls1938]MTC42798.1 pyridoxine/pyridoxal/pyridoxamine kinase [Providencia sp. wls1921]MTC77350.1 pyridoxine/pyridoxal/pyridoxamine kinase [Providencia sp. wls1916]WBM62256.1 pyridoxine/pyridoxal/pyridoxamine kinase [Providencia sp. PROV188]